MKNKKTVMAIIAVIALVLVIIGVTYAYWLVTKTQTNKNTISTGCLDITLDGEANDITLTNQFPLSDKDGLALTPYTFTITNNCTTSVDYQVNLESLDTADLEEISTSSIKIAFYEEGTPFVNPTLLSNYAETSTTISNALSANKLLIDTLAGKADGSTDNVITYNLLLWIDADAPISEMNKGFTSKISVTVGQNVVNPIKEGTLAYNIVSSYSDFPILGTNYEFDFNGSSVLWGTDANHDSQNGFSLAGDIVEATIEECQNGTKVCGNYTFGNTAEDYTSVDIYYVTDFTGEHSGDGYYSIMADIYGYNSGTDKQYINLGDYDINKTSDNFGFSYYYVGDAPNYVKLGTYTNTAEAISAYCPWSDCSIGQYNTLDECVAEIANGAPWGESDCTWVGSEAEEEEIDIIWRIVRVNGDGTLRLVYDTYITEEVNYLTLDTAYTFGQNLGYTYDNNGIETDSGIKSFLDNWYEEKLLSYQNVIADSIFCNGYRNKSNLICKNDTDKYSVSTSIGNGKLKYPIGLLTEDEIVFSGFNSKNTYNPIGGGNLATMTPYSAGTNVKYYYHGSKDTLSYVTSVSYVRPVINLKADVKFTGDGSYETPYEIVME